MKNNYHNNSKKKKLYNSHYEILSSFQAGRLINQDKYTIIYYTQHNELPYITEIKSAKEPFIYKRDLINFANAMGIPINNSYKKEYENVLEDYPDILYSEDIQEILDLKNNGIAFHIMKNNEDMNYKFKGNIIYVSKDDFKKFMWNHRRVFYQQPEYPSIEEYTDPKNLYNQDIPIPNAKDIIQPFKFVKSVNKENYLDNISLKEK